MPYCQKCGEEVSVKDKFCFACGAKLVYDEKNVSPTKEVQEALDIFDEVGCEFGCKAFQIIRKRIEEEFLGDCNVVISTAKEGISPSQQVYFAIANIASANVESGNYHIYRGVPNPLGPGPDLLRLFDAAVDKLVETGAVTEKEAKEQKEGIRENIKDVG